MSLCDDQEMTALYIHVPFCKTKCPYCSFISFPGMEFLFSRYINSLYDELAIISVKYSQPALQSIFFGGGTPTILAADQLANLLHSCKKLFRFESSIEITVEANPGTVNQSYFEILKKAGVNRISIGVQSFIDDELYALGRGHHGEEALRAIQQAKNANFDNINLDLMYGVHGQTVESWKNSLKLALACNPQHLSCYQLTIEEGTPYSVWQKDGKVQLPCEQMIDQMDVLTVELCKESGLRQYEISNFALPGKECQQNINYWLNGEYYAAGAGAVSYVSGSRAQREENPQEYCRGIEQKKEVIVRNETLDEEASFRESVVLGLRMIEGICCEDLLNRFGFDVDIYYGNALKRLKRMYLLERTQTHLRLTPRGRQVANTVMAELV